MREVVVPLDGSELAERAVPVARSVAAETRAGIRLVRAVTPFDTHHPADYLRDVADEHFGGSDVVTEVLETWANWSVADAIIRLVDADPTDVLLCMATHGVSGLGAAILGSTAEEVLHRTRRPILLVGHRCIDPWPGSRRGLLVPIDVSHIDDGLITTIAAVSRRGDLDPVLVKISHTFDVEDAHHPMEGLDEAARRLAELGLDAKQVHRFASNLPLTIADVARDEGAALILMATYVEEGVDRVLLGSLTMRTIRQSPVPVLTFAGPIVHPT